MAMGANSVKVNTLADTMRDAEGNLSLALKQELSDWTRSTTEAGDFGHAILTRLEVVRMDVDVPGHEPNKKQARMIIEVDVAEDMCDASGNLSSGCIASLIDWSTSLACRLLVLHSDPKCLLHVSVNLEGTSHCPAPLGCRVQIVSTTVSFDIQTATHAKSEIFDKTHNRRIASGWHTLMVPSSARL